MRTQLPQRISIFNKKNEPNKQTPCPPFLNFKARYSILTQIII